MTVGVNTAWKAKTSQPKASPWVFVYTSVSPRRGKRMKSSFPFPQPFGLTYQCPIRGVTNTHPRPLPKGGGIATVRSKEQFWRICYPPELNIRIFNPQ